jgi:hypothetical protein
MDLTQIILVVAAFVLLGWFALGTVYNIRHGEAVLRWLQGGLPRLGPRTTLRWLGSSAVMLGIGKARPPFREVELAVVLEPRDVPWFWLVARGRGRRDLLILRAQLVSAPAAEYDLLLPDSWSGRDALQRARERGWQESTVSDAAAPDAAAPEAALLAPAGRTGAADPAAALAAARQVHPETWRLSVRRERPHLELHVPLPDPGRDDAARFVEAQRALAQAVINAR